MFDNVMIGVDGRQGGEDAIGLARELASDRAEFTFAYVHGGFATFSRGDNYEFEAAERERATELLEEARAKAGLKAELRTTGSPSVGRGLHELAEEIGVAYDGSPESEHALSVARMLAKEQGAKLSAFEAVGVPSVAFIGVVVPDDDSITDLVDVARQRIADLGGVEPHAVYGRPAEELALYSASLDLLVTGSRDYGPIGRLVHGSTTQELARTARCPLLVLTKTARAASD